MFDKPIRLTEEDIKKFVDEMFELITTGQAEGYITFRDGIRLKRELLTAVEKKRSE